MGLGKERVEQLSIFGAPPLFPEELHVGRPNLGDRARFMARIEDIFDSRYLTNGGPYEAEFERRIAELAGARHCVAMNNATVALEIAIRALGMEGEVILPSFTFVATAHALQWQGITPVFCDIDPLSCTIDPEQVEALITPRTTGIVGVHLWGRICNVEALEEIARRRGLALLFDAAHAFGCSRGDTPVGSFGDAEVFSFHATKFVNSAEGGAVVTNDAGLADRMRLMRNFGFTDYDEVGYLGTNGKMTELAAAMGLTSLESMDDFVRANHRNRDHYEAGLAPIPGVHLLPAREGEQSNCQYVVVRIVEEEAGLDRDQLLEVLQAENVRARRYFYPGCHRMEPYRSLYPDVGARLPVTERLASEVLSLPTGTAVGDAEIEGICRLLALAVRESESVRARLERREPGSGPARQPRNQARTQARTQAAARTAPGGLLPASLPNLREP